MSLIPDSYQTICDRIASAAARSGRSADEIELVAVSKTWPAETITELSDCGHMLFGENRVQEAAVVLNLDHVAVGEVLGWGQKYRITFTKALAFQQGLKCSRRKEFIFK